jgi:hypothetical protein
VVVLADRGETILRYVKASIHGGNHHNAWNWLLRLGSKGGGVNWSQQT